MASHYIRSRSPFYWIRYRKPNGSWACKSSGIRIDHKGGLRRVNTMVAQHTASEQEDRDEGAGALFSEWVLSWIDYQYDNPKTCTRYHNAWTHISFFLDRKGVTHPNEVSYQLCHEYMRWRTTKSDRLCTWNTALTELRVLGAVEQEAVRRGYIPANPCSRLRLGRKNTKQKREITNEEIEEIETLLKKAPEWMQDSWTVGIKQGCRLSECAVPLDQIDLEAGTITFNAKGGKKHTAPLHAKLEPITTKARKRGSMKLVEYPTYPSKCWSQWFEKNGFHGISFHCLRVTVVTRLARAGYSEAQTMEYVGHASDMVHSIYRKLRPADLKHLGDAL
jgi:integrase